MISHGYAGLSEERFRAEFDWTGTADPTPFLAVPEALRVVGSLVPGGWPEVMERNRALALAARRIVGGALGWDAERRTQEVDAALREAKGRK